VLVDASAFAGRGGVVRRLAVAVFRRAFSGIDGVLVQNPDDHATLLGLRIINRSTRYEIVNGSGVSLADFCAEPRLEQPVRFLMAGRLLGTKGFREFVAAARLLRGGRSAEAEFQIAGGLDHHPAAISREELEAWMKEGHITYLGEVPDIRPHLNEASVFVLPSYYGEGTPRVILEAMAMSRPVITADSRGCREAVVEGETGRVVPPRDVEALATAMESYFDGGAAIVRHGLAGRARAVEKYEVGTVVRSMVAFLGLDRR
ncbi:MAG: glycosyltransferase, partial [Planctomycetota bacterium]|nr:glycosyltransferase [Planctomycetota bacterium]